MKDVLETLRLTLLKWNVAPLSVVGFLCWVVWTLVEYYKSVICVIDPTNVGALFIFLAGVVAILYKMYDSMQTNRSSKEGGEENE